MPMDTGKEHPITDHADPEQHAEPAEQGADERHRPVQEPVGVEQREAERGRRQEIGEQPVPFHLEAPLAQIAHVRREFRLQGIEAVDLGEEVDDLVLGRYGVPQVLAGSIPDIGHGPLAVHQTDDEIGFAGDAMESSRRVVLQYIPLPAAESLPVDLDMTAQPRLQHGNTVPCRAEHLTVPVRAAYGHQYHTFSRSQFLNSRVQMEMSLRRSTEIFATPSMPGRRLLLTRLSFASTRK